TSTLANTQFNGNKLFDASAGTVTAATAAPAPVPPASSTSQIQAGANAADSVNVKFNQLTADPTITNATSIDLTTNSTNLTSAKSQITDADFSAETTALAKAQILSQASTAMLSQANQSQQGVLKLLQ
ncbi:MAG: flagellin FliC, partial [Sphingomonas sp.]|uniref:flagellin n=1 Tax=Sphingomonas sp. TaxID=28214 RepID=UPI00258D9A2C